jgi:hypothetical protein
MIRSFLAAVLLCAAGPLEAQPEAAARTSALAVLESRPHALESLDTDGLLQRRFGSETWQGLTENQRDVLRAAVRERFAGMLEPGKSVPAGIAWSATAAGTREATDVILGLRLGDRTLKTRWRMKPHRSGWEVADVVLSDPGISLAKATLVTLGPEAVQRQSPGWRARTEVVPRAAVAVAISLAALLAAPRISPSGGRFLLGAAVILSLFFLTAAAVAAWQIVRQPYALQIAPAVEPWRRSEQLAVTAEGEGQPAAAEELRSRAVSLGAPAAPLDYQRGLAAKERGDPARARTLFAQALSAQDPAPGAERELAALDSDAGHLVEASGRIARYIAAAGPDPEALSLEAVLLTNLGRASEAVAIIGEARGLIGDDVGGAELEAKIRARASDAAGVVAALRPLALAGRLDREALRSDPAYLPIATDPAWVRFLSEK